MPYKVQKKGDKHCVVVSEGPKKGKEVACHDTRAKAVKQVRALYANDAAQDAASVSSVPCLDESCGRSFLQVERMIEHAEAVHTFDDIRRMLSEVIREKYGKPYSAGNPGTYVWIEDLAEDWVVFQVEEPTETTLYKASYSITDNEVTLGEPTEVRRRTVYEPVKKTEE